MSNLDESRQDWERPSRAADIADKFKGWWEAIQMKNREDRVPENSSNMYVQMSQVVDTEHEKPSMPHKNFILKVSAH